MVEDGKHMLTVVQPAAVTASSLGVWIRLVRQGNRDILEAGTWI